MFEDKQQIWERETIRELLHAGLKERRAARRWSIFFKLVFLSYLIIVSYLSMEGVLGKKLGRNEPFVAVVEISGPIMSDSSASADNITGLLEEAFNDELTRAVILKINSPGGTVVQSNRIFTELQRFKEQYPAKKVYAVIEDVGASGAYWVSCAADYIYADQASMIGSIGVLVESFGFTKAIEKLGVERRVYTAGENKASFDPFLHVNPQQKSMLYKELNLLHQMFIDLVKTQRGERLANDKTIFSGEVWLGTQALKLGLIDGFGDVKYVAHEIIGVDNLVEFSTKQHWFTKLANQTAGAFYGMYSKTSGFLSIVK